jgi:hypothetical protein
VATIEISFLLEFAFVVSGIVQFCHAFYFSKSAGSGSRFLLPTLSITEGIMALRNLIARAGGITLERK